MNLSEVYQKSIEVNKLALAQAIVATAGLQVVPFSEPLALLAAEMHQKTRGLGISFADCACLSLGIMEGLPILTCDLEWRNLAIGVRIDVLRPEM